MLYAEYVKVKNNEENVEEIGFRKASIGGKILIGKKMLEKHPNVRRTCEWLGISLMAFVVFFPRLLQLGYQWTQAFHSMCLNFGRILFAFNIFLTTLPSILGVKNTVIRTFLASNFFNFMARISFGVYVCHGLVILYIANTKRYDTYFWISDLYVNSLAIIVLSCVFGTLLTLFAELPVNYLTNGLLGALGGKQQSGVCSSGKQ